MFNILSCLQDLLTGWSLIVVRVFELLFNVMFLGRVLTQNSPVIPPRTITLTEPHTTSLQSIPGKKIAISPMKTPSKVDASPLKYSFVTGLMLPTSCLTQDTNVLYN